MKTHCIAGAFLVVAGLIIAAGPQYIFPPCEPTAGPSGTAMHMRCWWTARAELGIGLAVVLGGMLLLPLSSGSFRAAIAAMTLALAALAAIIPLGLIGVCASSSMPCRMAMLPALIIASTGAGLTAFVVCLRNRGKA